MLPTASTRTAIYVEALSPLARSILTTLLYFRIFDYPLRSDELLNFVHSNNKMEVQLAIARLVREGLVSTEDEYLCVFPEKGLHIGKRLKGNQRAARYLRIARRQAALLSWFPFIKCICISGSLSKYYMDHDSDIDYFIIASKQRLWLTKLLMSAIVKTLELPGMKKYFCPNYIITENNLQIADRNIFTAMEIITLVPLYNKQQYQKFLEANQWIRDYFPFYSMNLPVKPRKYKLVMSALWKSALFTKLDNAVFRMYSRRFRDKVNKGKIVAMGNDMVVTESDFKLHLNGHRHRILQQHLDNIREFENRFGVVL